MDSNEVGSEDSPQKKKIMKTAVDFQRRKLEKLMQKPDKPVDIPQSRKEKNFPDAPEFVRNVMGSSAGAGSGEFHVYRHIRRREYSRKKYIKEKSEQELKDEEYQKKIEENKTLAEEKTAKKRQKRLKKKARMKNKKVKGDDSTQDSEQKKVESSESGSENDDADN